jgi:hypothetical protein
MSLALAAVCVVSTGLAFAQQPLKFEAAAIKPNKSPDRNSTWGWSEGGRFKADNIPLKFLILSAFQLKESQLTGLPGWADGESTTSQRRRMACRPGKRRSR